MAEPERDTSAGLIPLLISAVSEGCAAGIVAGAALAVWHPALNTLLRAEPQWMLALAALLAVCMQAGAAVSLGVALARRPGEPDR